MDRGSFIVFDIETTGLSLVNDEIIQFHAQKYADYRKIDELDVYIKQPVPLSDEIVKLTGISDQILSEKGVSPSAAYAKIKAFCDWQDVFAGHNLLSFDWPFLMVFCDKYNDGRKFAQITADKLIDTMKIGKYLTPDQRKWPKLSLLCSMLGIVFDSGAAHNAKYDVTKTAECLIELVGRKLVNA